uniref:Uncharacterized protein n=1 Tax=Arundo donax TaxID=35708 RepID=A0A0A9H3M1_ARUDO
MGDLKEGFIPSPKNTKEARPCAIDVLMPSLRCCLAQSMIGRNKEQYASYMMYCILFQAFRGGTDSTNRNLISSSVTSLLAVRANRKKGPIL